MNTPAAIASRNPFASALRAIEPMPRTSTIPTPTATTPATWPVLVPCPSTTNGADEDEDRRDAAGDGVDEAHVRDAVAGREEGEVAELERCRRGDGRNRRGVDIPGEDGDRREGDHSRDEHERKSCLGLCPATDEHVADAVDPGGGEGEQERGRRHVADTTASRAPDLGGGIRCDHV